MIEIMKTETFLLQIIGEKEWKSFQICVASIFTDVVDNGQKKLKLKKKFKLINVKNNWNGKRNYEELKISTTIIVIHLLMSRHDSPNSKHFSC